MSFLDALHVIPRCAVPNPELLAHLMNGGRLDIEFSNARFQPFWNRDTGDPLALGFGPGYVSLDPFTDERIFKFFTGASLSLCFIVLVLPAVRLIGQQRSLARQTLEGTDSQ